MNPLNNNNENNKDSLKNIEIKIEGLKIFEKSTDQVERRQTSTDVFPTRLNPANNNNIKSQQSIPINNQNVELQDENICSLFKKIDIDEDEKGRPFMPYIW